MNTIVAHCSAAMFKSVNAWLDQVKCHPIMTSYSSYCMQNQCYIILLQVYCLCYCTRKQTKSN